MYMIKVTSLQEQLSRHEQEIENYKEKYQMKVFLSS